MVAALNADKIETGFCILFLEGLLPRKKKYSENVDEGIFRFSGHGIYNVTVVLDLDDPFGISDFLENTSTGGGQRSEIYVSHSDAFFTPDIVESKVLLRNKTTEIDYLKTMREEFEKGKKEGIKLF